MDWWYKLVCSPPYFSQIIFVTVIISHEVSDRSTCVAYTLDISMDENNGLNNRFVIFTKYLTF
ncbi:unnamed protein product, partial [Schistosoma haematobium]